MLPQPPRNSSKGTELHVNLCCEVAGSFLGCCQVQESPFVLCILLTTQWKASRSLHATLSPPGHPASSWPPSMKNHLSAATTEAWWKGIPPSVQRHRGHHRAPCFTVPIGLVLGTLAQGSSGGACCLVAWELNTPTFVSRWLHWVQAVSPWGILLPFFREIKNISLNTSIFKGN